MARDYEDLHDVENLSDAELTALARQELAEYPDLDTTGLDIEAVDGRVRVAGRVGTESEVQLIEQALTDSLGIPVDNELVVDEVTRQTQPEAADEANVRVYGGRRGAHGGADRTDDAAEHLLADTRAEQFGTDDVREAIERGYSYNPPDTPIQEGTLNRENH